MKIKLAEAVEAKDPNMPDASKVTMRMLIGPDDGAPVFNMRMFDVAPGGHTPLHRHDWEHEVYVLAGAGVVSADGSDTPVSAGHCLLIPPGETHQFRNTGTETMRFLCLVPQQ